MRKNSHFSGQPLYGQVTKLLDKSKVLQFSREKGGERYTKRFNCWIHLVVMLYAVIMRFDSLREITASLLAETRKLAHLGISFKIGRSTLADANKRRSEAIFESIYRDLYATYRHVLSSDGLMEVRIQNVEFTKQKKDGETIRHKSRIITYVDAKKRKLVSLLTNDMESDPEEIVAIYRQRWEIELLFKHMKQNFPLKYFYGESANAIKVQIWVTLIANLLLMVMQKGLTRKWSFSGLATMVRITLMYYVDFYSLFNNPEREWEVILSEATGAPPEPSLFD